MIQNLVDPEPLVDQIEQKRTEKQHVELEITEKEQVEPESPEKTRTAKEEKLVQLESQDLQQLETIKLPQEGSKEKKETNKIVEEHQFQQVHLQVENVETPESDQLQI